MEAKVVNMKGKKVSTVDLPEAIFEAPVRVDLMHQAFVRQMANARLGTHKTKTRHEVRGGGAKPWRQKGTGRARQGSIRSAQWVGGGKIHTPRPRDYSKKMPRKMRRAALRSALSVKASAESLVFVDSLELKNPKTSEMAALLETLVGASTALVVIPAAEDAYENVARSAHNLSEAKVLNANYLNIRDLLGYEKIVIPVEALDVISAYLA
jgi:large subunit ribosomal protein L4